MSRKNRRNSKRNNSNQTNNGTDAERDNMASENNDNTESKPLKEKWDDAKQQIEKIKRCMAWLNWSPITHFLRNNHCYGNYYYLWLKNTLRTVEESEEIKPIMKELTYAANNFDSVRGIVKAVAKIAKTTDNLTPVKKPSIKDILMDYELKEILENYKLEDILKNYKLEDIFEKCTLEKLEQAYIEKRIKNGEISDKYGEYLKKLVDNIEFHSKDNQNATDNHGTVNQSQTIA